MKHLKKEGQFDYDYKNDVLFFKVKEREYSHSIELSNLVIDFDEENFVVGLQIFNASEIFKISKDFLRSLRNFKMECKVEGGAIQLDVSFSMMKRNKEVLYKPIIFERVGEDIPDSKVLCDAVLA